jgi:hypothetical protein
VQGFESRTFQAVDYLSVSLYQKFVTRSVVKYGRRRRKPEGRIKSGVRRGRGNIVKRQNVNRMMIRKEQEENAKGETQVL